MRKITGRDFGFDQQADEYDYYPYRFGIRYVDYTKKDKIETHQAEDCWVCRIKTY